MSREIRKELLMSLLARASQNHRHNAAAIDQRGEVAVKDYVISIRRARSLETTLDRIRFDGEDYHLVDDRVTGMIKSAGIDI